MKSNDFLNEGIGEDAQAMAQDHEVQMARQECYHAAEDAITLHKLLRHVGEQQGLEGWVSAKITLAADYLNTVREHLEYQLMSGAEQQEPINVVTVAEDAITHEDLAPVVEATDMMAKERKKRLADAEKKKQERLAQEKAKKDKKQGVAEGSSPFGNKCAGPFASEERAKREASRISKELGVKRYVEKTSDGKYIVVKKQGVAEGEVYDLEKEYGYEKPKAQPKRDSVPPTRPSLHPEDTDFMDPVERRLRADQARVKAAWAAHNAKKGVEETRVGNRMSDIEVGSPKIVYYKGKAVGEVGIDHEASPGNGQYYMKHYLTGKDMVGYDTKKEALADLKHMVMQQVSENAGSVATVVNPTPKNKAKVGTLFGGTYKQKKAAK